MGESQSESSPCQTMTSGVPGANGSTPVVNTLPSDTYPDTTTSGDPNWLVQLTSFSRRGNWSLRVSTYLIAVRYVGSNAREPSRYWFAIHRLICSS